MTSSRLSRRGLFSAAGLAGLTAAGCGEDAETATTTDIAAMPATGTCRLTPEMTEGPYYVDDAMVRSDITEGRPGLPLELRLTVQNAESCEPIPDATVEIWHADAGGAYSGFDAEGTFLRGAQKADGEGLATFKTIYPGSYPGRTPHIHMKVHVSGSEVHTGQLYFDDTVSAKVYGTDDYADRGTPPTTNANDGIYSDGGDRSTLALTKSGDGYIGRLVLAIAAA